MTTGIISAFIAMIAWGVGDFFIQKSTRKIGDWQTLFLIALFGTVMVLPFVWSDIGKIVLLPSNIVYIIFTAAILLFVAALFEFEALKKGKLSIVEPIWSFEIVVSSIFAFFILREPLSTLQIILILILMIGLFLISYKDITVSKRIIFEKGIKIAFLSALLMGITNFFVGWGARETNPLMINFVINSVSLVGSFIFIARQRKIKDTLIHLIEYPKVLAPMMILDNIAWIAFAIAMVSTPIGIAVAISESYIIIAVLLGIFITKEKLLKHQYIGLLVAILSAIILSTTI